MSEARPPRRIARSIGALFAGFVAVVALSIATDVVMHTSGIFPALGQAMSDGLFLLATAYRTLYGILGAYITARLAPNRPMLHALVGGLFGLGASIVGAVVTWNEGPAFGPHWYPLALAAFALPQAWVGGALVQEQPST